MNSTIINESFITKLLEDFRYDLIKAIAFILLFTAAIIYANTEIAPRRDNRHFVSYVWITWRELSK